MPTRKTIVYVHLIIAGIFLPFLLLMPTTGSLYLLGFKGSEVKTEAFKISGLVPEDEKEQEKFFREEFKKNSIDFDFEYIRSNGKEFTFRPTSRVYYVANSIDDGLTVSKVDPNLLKRLMELHKGHGPQMMRWFEVLFALALLMIAFSGIWLAWTVKPYLKATAISLGIGTFIIVICLI